jgi:hypothetical protein
MSVCGLLDSKTLQCLDGTAKFCLLSYEGSWNVFIKQSSLSCFGEYSSRVGHANMPNPDMTSSPTFCIFPILGINWGHQPKGSQSGTLKFTSTEKRVKNKN